MQCLIRSVAQTLCDDLAGAEKAEDGKRILYMDEIGDVSKAPGDLRLCRPRFATDGLPCACTSSMFAHLLANVNNIHVSCKAGWVEVMWLCDNFFVYWLANLTREAPTASPKSLPISGAKNEPSGHGEVLLL